jgi:hypothetical protein
MSYRVVGEQERPDLLFDQFRGFGSEYPVVACLVGFDLVEGQFNFPAFAIGRGEFDCGCELVVEQRGDQAEQFPAAGPVFDRVLHDADDNGLGGVEVGTGRRGGEQRLAASAADLRVDQH